MVLQRSLRPPSHHLAFVDRYPPHLTRALARLQSGVNRVDEMLADSSFLEHYPRPVLPSSRRLQIVAEIERRIRQHSDRSEITIQMVAREAKVAHATAQRVMDPRQPLPSARKYRRMIENLWDGDETGRRLMYALYSSAFFDDESETPAPDLDERPLTRERILDELDLDLQDIPRVEVEDFDAALHILARNRGSGSSRQSVKWTENLQRALIEKKCILRSRATVGPEATAAVFGETLLLDLVSTQPLVINLTLALDDDAMFAGYHTHPNDYQITLLIAGEVDVFICDSENGTNARKARLAADRPILIPPGTWHRSIGRSIGSAQISICVDARNSVLGPTIHDAARCQITDKAIWEPAQRR